MISVRCPSCKQMTSRVFPVAGQFVCAACRDAKKEKPNGVLNPQDPVKQERPVQQLRVDPPREEPRPEQAQEKLQEPAAGICGKCQGTINNRGVCVPCARKEYRRHWYQARKANPKLFPTNRAGKASSTKFRAEEDDSFMMRPLPRTDPAWDDGTMPAVEGEYERSCLKCRRIFHTVGKFIRLCHSCHNSNAATGILADRGGG